jgi:hypothetical protein
MIRTHNWYNLNSTRRYPLDDAATGESDTGESVPHDVIVDGHLRFPASLASYAFISSLHVSEHLVSLTILGATYPAERHTECFSSSSSLSSSSGGPPTVVPLAVLSIPRSELITRKQYPIQASADGVGGWFVFGEMIEAAEYSGRFAGVNQSMLATRIARSYRDLPIPSMGKLYDRNHMQGLVLVKGGTDVKVSKGSRLIDGEMRDALVIGLNGDVTGRNVLDHYRGPCSGRPESYTCNREAIESINSVTPDCDGNVDITFTSCVELGPASDPDEGVIVDYCLGLADACTRDNRLPKDGVLPNDYIDQCLVSSESLSASSESSLTVSPPEPPISTALSGWYYNGAPEDDDMRSRLACDFNGAQHLNMGNDASVQLSGDDCLYCRTTSQKHASLANAVGLPIASGKSFTISTFFYADSITDTEIIRKWEGGGDREWAIKVIAGVVTVYYSADGAATTTLSTALAVTAYAWHYMELHFDVTTGTYTVRLDGTTYTSTAGRDGPWASGTSPIRWASDGGGSATDDVRFANTLFLKSAILATAVLTTDERAFIRNTSANGLSNARQLSEFGVVGSDGETIVSRATFYYPMTDTGTLTDAAGNHSNLTDNNGVESALGITGHPAFAFSCFAKCDVAGGSDTVVSTRDTDSSKQTGFSLEFNSAPAWRVVLSSMNAGGADLVTLDSAAVNVGQTYHVAFSYDPDENILSLWIDGVETTVNWDAGCLATDNDLLMGCMMTLGSTTFFFDGAISRPMWLNGNILTAGNIAQLAGIVRFYNLNATLQSRMTSRWTFGEYSDGSVPIIRKDQINSNNGADPNNIPSIYGVVAENIEDGDSIFQWINRQSSSSSVTQTTPARMPIFDAVNTDFNSWPAVQFSSSLTQWLSTLTGGLLGHDEFTVYMVVAANDTSNAYRVFQYTDASADKDKAYLDLNGIASARVSAEIENGASDHAIATALGTFTAGRATAIAGTWGDGGALTPTNVTAHLNDDGDASGSMTDNIDNDLDTLVFGANEGDISVSNQYLDGHIVEVLIYGGTTHNAAERTTVFDYFIARYLTAQSNCLLPLTEEFATEPEVLVVTEGAWSVPVANEYIAGKVDRRNLSVIECDYTTCLEKIIYADVQLRPGGPSANVGVVINWQTSGTFLLAEIDRGSASFRVRYFNGTNYVTIATAGPLSLSFNYPYRITVTVTDLGGGNANMECVLTGISTIATLNVQSTRAAALGLTGIHANKSLSAVDEFSIKEIP